MTPSTDDPLDDEGDAAPAVSQAEHMARRAPDRQIAPHEKQAIAAETSREEDA
jgi:hypothetical protein